MNVPERRGRDAIGLGRAVAYICAAVLTEQSSNEQDVGLVLRRCVGDKIDRVMEEIDRLLGRERTYAVDDGEGGDE